MAEAGSQECTAASAPETPAPQSSMLLGGGRLFHDKRYTRAVFRCGGLVLVLALGMVVNMSSTGSFFFDRSATVAKYQRRLRSMNAADAGPEAGSEGYIAGAMRWWAETAAEERKEWSIRRQRGRNLREEVERAQSRRRLQSKTCAKQEKNLEKSDTKTKDYLRDELDDKMNWDDLRDDATTDDPSATVEVEVDDIDCEKDPGWLNTFLCILGVLYLFMAIAIVCDELFVPALEGMSEKFGFSDDVAGATLMAAGGSAPELATSLIGTFSLSDVGFGTIVGSAVFNVLFVIGMCAMFTPPEFAPLKLTWWPLFRDCTYYIITLLSLAIFFGVTSYGEITLIEAIIQFMLYLGYVYLMSKNRELEVYVKTKILKQSMDEPVAPESGKPYAAEGDPNASFLKPSTFRAGILQLLTQGKSIAETAGVGVVSKIKGDVNETFSALDTDSNGQLDVSEVKKLLSLLGPGGEEITDQRAQEMIAELDKNNNGKIDRDEFTHWYLASEERLRSQTREVFNKFDKNDNGSIEITELRALLESLLMHSGTTEIERAMTEFESEVNVTEGECSFNDFQKWFEESLFWKEMKTDAEEAQESTNGMFANMIEGVKAALSGKLPPGEAVPTLLLFPINFCLATTIPDCRVCGREGQCFRTFGMSIVWIGIFSFFMVDFATAIGIKFGIPAVIMGLTFLAAGTSVPDLLSSVVVAKQGKGDMAVSSSIGSNIFDVAVGLPLPWMLFNLAFIGDCNVVVGAKGIEISISILLLMVMSVILSIALSGWKMSRSLGLFMFFLYFLYVIQEVVRVIASGELAPPVFC